MAKHRNAIRRYKYPKQYHPRIWPEPRWIETAAHALAYDCNNPLPRRHEKYVTLHFHDMERPVGRVSEKNWQRIYRCIQRATHDVFDFIATFPRKRIKPPLPPPKPCRIRGWTWSRSLPTRPEPPMRQRLYLPRWLLPDVAAPPRTLYLTEPGEGWPCSHEPGDVTVFGMVG